MEQLDKHLSPQEQAEETEKKSLEERSRNTETVSWALSWNDTQLGKQSVDSVAKGIYEKTVATLSAQNPDYQTQLGKLNEAAIQFQGEMNALYARGNVSTDEVIARLATFEDSLQGAIGSVEKGDAERWETQAENMRKEANQREQSLQERKDEFLKRLAEQVEQWRTAQQRDRAENARDAGNEEARAAQESAKSLIEWEGWSFPEKAKG